MACTNCSTNHISEDGTPMGCKGNGNCGTSGCSHLATYDWLNGMELPQSMKSFDVVEVRFKNGRKSFYRNIYNHPINVGDAIAVEGSPGHDVGMVSLMGELVRLQMKKKNVNYSAGDMRKVYRKVSEEDLEKWKDAKAQEDKTMFRAREIAQELNLVMKISDVEYQGDGTKATFYYTADERVDFRNLIKRLAEEFKVRIEMKQIGARQEASRVGGIGSCGRELCCSTWLTDFRSVSTTAARYQQLSLNPQKLAGQCGKLKCCLNYELDMYLEAYKDFPSTDIYLETKEGRARHFKSDIFKRIMWYILDTNEPTAPQALSVDRVKEIVALNKKGKKPEKLKDFTLEIETVVEEPAFDNVVGQDDLTRFDKKNNKRRKSGGQGNRNQNNRRKNTSNKNRNQQGERDDAKKVNPRNQSSSKNQGGNKEGRKPQQKKNNSPKAENKPGSNKSDGNNKQGGNNQRRKNYKKKPSQGGNKGGNKPSNQGNA